MTISQDEYVAWRCQIRTLATQFSSLSRESVDGLGMTGIHASGWDRAVPIKRPAAKPLSATEASEEATRRQGQAHAETARLGLPGTGDPDHLRAGPQRSPQRCSAP